jgi:hypothetical protein
VKLGDGPEDVLAAYTRVAAERDRALAQQKVLETDKYALSALSTKLQAERKGIDAALGRSRQELAALKALQEEQAKAQRLKLTEMDSAYAEQQRIVQETGAGVLARKYRIAWYTAAMCIAATALMALGLIWAVARNEPPGPATTGSPSKPEPRK